MATADDLKLALIDAVLYGSTELPLNSREVLANWENLIGKAAAARIFDVYFWFFNLIPLATRKRTFMGLSSQERFEFMKGLTDSSLMPFHLLGNITCLPFKIAYLSAPQVHESAGVAFRKDKVCPEPEPRWMRQINPASSFDNDETIEADIVVVGTGAGGAVVAKELAEKGFAVAIIEAGQMHRRDEFTGNPLDMVPKLYLNSGFTGTIGNTIIPIQMGRAVGGTTLINSATCFRAPDDVLNKWVDIGLRDFTPEKMAPYFDKVEQNIHVMECEEKYIGPIGQVIKEGCTRLGYSCGPLRHNTLDCDGQGVCTQGCPTDAKQSTNISYIPKALNAAAQLFTGFEVKQIITDGQKAAGIKAKGIGKNGNKINLIVRANTVILSAGAFMTPILIKKNRLSLGNRWVGRNLNIHPAVFVMAYFPDREMKNDRSIPQGYMIDEFEREGLRFEGGTPPFTVMASLFPGIGKVYTDRVKDFNHMAVFGCMVKDTSTGYVMTGLKGVPLVYYSLSKADTNNLVRALKILGEVYFAAGAKEIYLPTFYRPVIKNQKELGSITSRNWKAHDLMLSAFHALGTARIGTNSGNSVAGPNHECHMVPGLFIVDGSSVPTSLGVNPQETIMAMATRAADKIADKLIDP